MMIFAKHKLYIVLVMLILCVLFLLSCTSNTSFESNAQPNTIEATSQIVSTITPVGGEVIVDQVTLTTTSTSSPAPTENTLQSTRTPQVELNTTIVVQTPQSSPTPTEKPTTESLPTIAAANRGAIYSQYMASNRDCLLPCWWGFDLGVASSTEIIQLYSTFGASIVEREFDNNRSRITVSFRDSEILEERQIRHSFSLQNSIVESALVDSSSEAYQMDSILAKLGEPEEIWLWTIPESYQGLLPVRLRLYYPTTGVFVLYGTIGKRIGENIQVCFDETGESELLLWLPEIWDPDNTKTIEDRSAGSSSFTLEGFSIDEVSDWTASDFFVELTDENSAACLETPSSYWTLP